MVEDQNQGGLCLIVYKVLMRITYTFQYLVDLFSRTPVNDWVDVIDGALAKCLKGKPTGQNLGLDSLINVGCRKVLFLISCIEHCGICWVLWEGADAQNVPSGQKYFFLFAKFKITFLCAFMHIIMQMKDKLWSRYVRPQSTCFKRGTNLNQFWMDDFL